MKKTTYFLALLALCFMFELVSCGGSDSEGGGGGSQTTIEEKLCGQWIGYVWEEDEPVVSARLVMNSNHTATLTKNSAVSLAWAANQAARTMVLNIQDGGKTITVNTQILCLEKDAMVVVDEFGGIFAFIKPGTEQRITRSMLVGNWITGMEYCTGHEAWEWDEIQMNANSTGRYIENANRRQNVYGDSDEKAEEDDFDYTFNEASQKLHIVWEEDNDDSETLSLIKGNRHLIFVGEEDGDEVELIIGKDNIRTPSIAVKDKDDIPSGGGTTGGDTGGSTGGSSSGSTGGSTGGSAGGSTGGNTGGSTGGSTTQRRCIICGGSGKCERPSSTNNKYYCWGSGKCRNCGGSGWINGVTGKVGCGFCDKPGTSTKPGNGVCGYCHGAGKCSTCGGKGYR